LLSFIYQQTEYREGIQHHKTPTAADLRAREACDKSCDTHKSGCPKDGKQKSSSGVVSGGHCHTDKDLLRNFENAVDSDHRGHLVKDQDHHPR
jgi:hypothetical protein